MSKVTRTTVKKTAQIAKSLNGRAKGEAKAKTKSKKTSPNTEVPLTPQNVVDNLRESFDAERNAANAKAQKKYMRDQFEFFGLKSPKRREISKDALLSCSDFQQVELHLLLRILWQQMERDFQLFGIDVCDRYSKTLCGHSLQDSMRSVTLVKELIETKSWWDTVDMLASKVIGRLVAAHRMSLSAVMDEWIKDKDLWVRRSAIQHQLMYKNKTDETRLFRYCTMTAHEQDFFIRKAIGWALREYSKTNAEAVKTFVKTNQAKLSPLSQKEALKHV